MLTKGDLISGSHWLLDAVTHLAIPGSKRPYSTVAWRYFFEEEGDFFNNIHCHLCESPERASWEDCTTAPMRSLNFCAEKFFA